MIPVADARSFVLRDLTALPAVHTALDDALDCVASDAVLARHPVPGFTNSSMDGYALIAADTLAAPAHLRVTGSIMAGDTPSVSLRAGEAVRIMTGAALPEGADAVCKIEDVVVEEDGAVVIISAAIRQGDCVRHPGEDIAVGQTLVARGDVLGPARLGVLASQGFTSVMVHPRPRVGVLSTGNELSDAPDPMAIGKIRDTNRPALLASLRQSGFDATDLGRASDDETEIATRLNEGLAHCDAIVTTGGVSVGDVDFVKTVLSQLCGDRAQWMQVAVRPGKPFAFGIAGPIGTPIFGLPGNPVSTLASFELFVRPALRLLAGYQFLERPTVSAVLDCALPRHRDGKLHLVHVGGVFHDDGRLHIERAAREGSHLLSAIAGANAIALVPDGEGLAPGDEVRTILLDVSTWMAAPLEESQ
ncbi:MAG TPA: gephyrin-like molybdotransferase Glp [Acidimicrobiales bacterium]|nr:gephyrin-like molybdotransferase Glp [Acidimicrobiales bacterium]